MDENDKIKVLATDWYTNKDGSIGIVLYYDGHGRIRAKIKKVMGRDVEFDTRDVLDWGSTFPVEAALILAGIVKLDVEINIKEFLKHFDNIKRKGKTMNSEITDILKNEGLDIAEEEAVAVVKAAFKVMALILPKVSETAGAVIGPMILVLEPRVLALLDKIDGQDNPEY